MGLATAITARPLRIRLDHDYGIFRERSTLSALYMALTPEIAFETHREHLLSLIWLRMGPDLRRRMDPEDVLQEVAIEAINCWHTLEDQTHSRAWLVTLAKRKLARILRDQVGVAARDPRREDSIKTDFPVADRRSGPITVADRKDRLNLLEAALQKLKPEHRDVILLSRIEKLSAKEIGAEMDRSENAVHLLLGRALKNLAQHLKF